jgi:hypothetical protein
LRYGTIISDTSYEASEGYYKGFNRHYTIFIHGLLAEIRMNNGNLLGYGYSDCDKYEKEKVIEHFSK